MSYVTKRVSRKNRKSAQEIISDEASLTRWMRENTTLVVYTTGALLLVIVITVGFFWMKNGKKAAADSALSHAMALYQTTVSKISEEAYANTVNLNAALESLDKVASDYGGSPQSRAALLFKANVLFRLGRYQDAADTINRLETKNRKFVNDMDAYYLLARCYEAMGDFKKALENYGTAKKNTSGEMELIIDTDMARCYELSGDKNAAVAIYEDILSEHPDTLFATRAKKKLATLGVTEPETS